MLRNGSGKSSTRMSSDMLLAEWPTNMAKKASGCLLPQPKHVPFINGCQFLEIGLQEKIERVKKINPQTETRIIRAMVTRRARRYCLV
jgi:hypothetical protein